MIVISDASPLMNLGTVGLLDLLHRLYESVAIPQAVFDEIVIAGIGQPAADEVKTAAWVEVRQVNDRTLVQALNLELDIGEAEAIALATELKADLLLMDERKGRAVAARLGIRFIGLLGVLVAAKREGFIVEVKPVVDDLISRAGFWISKDLYNAVVKAADE